MGCRVWVAYIDLSWMHLDPLPLPHDTDTVVWPSRPGGRSADPRSAHAKNVEDKDLDDYVIWFDCRV